MSPVVKGLTEIVGFPRKLKISSFDGKNIFNYIRVFECDKYVGKLVFEHFIVYS